MGELLSIFDNTSIPSGSEDWGVLEWALAYAKAGLYVLPVLTQDGSGKENRSGKNPGSVVGAGWHHKSSRDPAQIAAWFTGKGEGELAIALHIGRSGLVALDVDEPQKLHGVWKQAVEGVGCNSLPPFHASRAQTGAAKGKGHYLFACFPGEYFANTGVKRKSAGGGEMAWGEVRGRNGVIIVEPSPHPAVREGTDASAAYRWIRTGDIPLRPDYLAEVLPKAGEVDDSLTDSEVQKCFASWSKGADTSMLKPVIESFNKEIEDGGSHHEAMVTALCWAMREARAGFYTAKTASSRLKRVYKASFERRNEPADRGRLKRLDSEWAGLLAWCCAQARRADVKETQAEVNKRKETADKKPGKKRTERTVADKLLDLAEELGIVAAPQDEGKYYFMTGCKPGDPFGSGGVLQPGRKLTSVLSHAYFDKYGKGASPNVVVDTARMVLYSLSKGKSKAYPNPRYCGFNRKGNRPYDRSEPSNWLNGNWEFAGEIDLCDEHETVVRISSDSGVEVLKSLDSAEDRAKRQGLFLRDGTEKPLPIPVLNPNGSDGRAALRKLRPFLNCSEADFRLVLGWLIHCMFSNVAHPFLMINGEQGSAKSTATEVLKKLIDPTKPLLQTIPHSQKDFVVSAMKNWMTCYENVSSLQGSNSDDICRIVTGSGVKTRELYTDDGSFVAEAKRVIVMNGIDVGGVRDDLASRMLYIHMNAIDEKSRLPEDDVDEEFNKVRAEIFGGLCEAMVGVLQLCARGWLENWKRKRFGEDGKGLPRMTEFALTLAALDKLWGLGDVDSPEGGRMFRDYLRSNKMVRASIAEDDEIIDHLRMVCTASGGYVRGSASQILTMLNDVAAADGGNKSRTWPRNARSLSSRLLRARQGLIEAGWEIDESRPVNVKIWSIRAPGKSKKTDEQDE